MLTKCGINYPINTADDSSENEVIVKYWRSTIENLKFMYGKMDNESKAGNVCYRVVLNLWTSIPLYKNVCIKIRRTIILIYSLFWDILQPSLVVSSRRFGITYWSHLQFSQVLLGQDLWCPNYSPVVGLNTELQPVFFIKFDIQIFEPSWWSICKLVFGYFVNDFYGSV